eukprot:5304192-Prorocentrum_lima.AAC.1
MPPRGGILDSLTPEYPMCEYSTAASYKYDGNIHDHDSYQSLLATHSKNAEAGYTNSGSKKTAK